MCVQLAEQLKDSNEPINHCEELTWEWIRVLIKTNKTARHSASLNKLLPCWK